MTRRYFPVTPDGGDEIGGRWVRIYRFDGSLLPLRAINGRTSHNSLGVRPNLHRKASV